MRGLSLPVRFRHPESRLRVFFLIPPWPWGAAVTVDARAWRPVSWLEPSHGNAARRWNEGWLQICERFL